ncbi:hypothetical protein K2Z83_11635 [Oscillochloris sp. ZM17-4]|uniref:hypothetical protein n=1 Tax=Oscillochloris sp. ZM17-4 TaxID=2866714 RepID=UPI001C738CA2|nr:hypothetical protein [Oscillochloris sp. ZM17-4]MBX0328327.1 hypothetical protein [Oscillochloris sp. ZM17-4]
MSPAPRFCTHCGAPQDQGSTRCRACDRPLSSPAAHEPAGAPPHVPAFRTPASEAWPALSVLIAICAIGYGAAYAAGCTDLAYALLFIGLTLLLTLLLLWGLGRANARQGRAFLGSSRPLVRWAYTPEEWQQVRSFAYEQQQRDRPPLGCLPPLFAAPGLLAGLMIGADTGLAEALVGALVGTLVGALVGGTLILPVRLINHLAATRALRADSPATVAIGAHELFYEQLYFDARRHRLAAVHLNRHSPPRLRIDRYASRFSLVYAFPTVILVPPRMLAAVQEALPRIEIRGAGSAVDDGPDEG